MGIDSHLSTCVGTQSPKYLEMAQGHISLSHSHSVSLFEGSPTKGDIEIAYVSTKEQLADIFTKLRNELNILDSRNFD
jgi:hypothetical protein